MKLYVLAALFLITGITAAHGQNNREVPQSQQFRLAEGIVRIAEPGQIADTINVWGDINNPGRYLVARGTDLTELVSYTRGPSRYTTVETAMDWSKVRLEVGVSQFNGDTGEDVITNFVYRYDEPVPNGMRDYGLNNGDVVSIQVRRRPSFADYVRVAAPALSIVATSFVILDRLSGN